MIAFYAAPARAWDWTHSVVDDTGSDEGQYVSLVMDAAGGVHLGYFRYDPNSEGGRNPRYATKANPLSGGPWSLATADGTASSGAYTSLVLAPDGTPHLAYYESELMDLRHAWRPPGQGWQSETVDSPGLVGTYTSIGIAGGTLYISYYDATAPALKLATKPLAGGPWSFELVDNTAVVGLYSSLSVTPRLTISYYDLTNTALKVATKTGSTWTLATVDSLGDVGRYTSIVQDSENTYVAYYDNFLGNLKFAERHLDGPWSVITLASNGDVGRDPALSLDNHGRPHITYYNNDTDDLLYTGRYENAWAYDVVATSGSVGRYSGLGFNADGLPLVAYYDEGAGTLRFAYGVGEPTGLPQTRLELPGPVAAWAPAANPSRNGAAFLLTLREPGRVRMDVFDVRGRAVRTLADGDLPPGVHTFAWDGRDAGGLPVGPGAYFARVAAGAGAATTRVTVLR